MKSLRYVLEASSKNDKILKKELEVATKIMNLSSSKIKKIAKEIEKEVISEYKYNDEDYYKNMDINFVVIDCMAGDIALGMPEYLKEIEDELEDRIKDDGDKWLQVIIEDWINVYDIKSDEYEYFEEFVGVDFCKDILDQLFRKNV